MRLADWIKDRIEELRNMVQPHHEPPFASVRHVGKRIELSFDSSPANLALVRKKIEKFCHDCGLDVPACEEMGLVVNEALANVIRHAYHGETDKPVEVSAEPWNGGVEISIRDWGTGHDPSVNPLKEPDPLTPGGLGLICLKKLTDEARFEAQTDGMKLVLIRTSSGSKATQPHDPERRKGWDSSTAG